MPERLSVTARPTVRRRDLFGGALACAASLALGRRAAAKDATFKFGLTPVFLSNDLELLGHLRSYLEARLAGPVELVTRRTYQEITALLVSGQIHSAWICGYPYVQFKAELDLVATPVWRGKPLYQSYLIAAAGRAATDWQQLEGDVHAFSDPDSNSGFLVTRALLAENKLLPQTFFSQHFFTYGHRDVIRAVGSGLARSGSVDGYVYEVMRETGCVVQALFAKGQVMLPPLWRLELRCWHRTCQRFEISSSEYSPYMSHFAPFIRRGLLLHCVSSTQ